VLFNGTTSQRWLSTAPGLPTTHWFQLRCVLQQPLLVLTPNTKLSGSMRLVAHARQSYDVHVELHAPPVAPGMAPQKVRTCAVRLLLCVYDV
jgi:histone-arginine methyltransferase CARM1